MSIGFVYKWTNNINGNWYIGSHNGGRGKNYIGGGTIFRRAINKYGLENFSRTIIYEGKEFRNIEEFILKELDAGGNPQSYNLHNHATGGSQKGRIGNRKGAKASLETRRKQSKGIKEFYANGGIHWTKRPGAEKSLRKMAISKLGKSPWNKGKKLSEEKRKKLRGRVVSTETRRKMSESAKKRWNKRELLCNN